MKPKFPSDREDKRRMLLGAVDDVREVLAAGVEEGEKLRTLPPASVAALRDSGLLALKLPAIAGGAEADPVTQIEVIEKVSYIDPAAGWCLFIGAATMSLPAAHLPDQGVARMFSGDRFPTVAGGGGLVPGDAVEVAGGYRLSGRWSWGSGIRHAEWVLVMARIIRDGHETGEGRMFVVPAEQVEIHDNWFVMGLSGTGSCDYSVEDLFVPKELTWDLESMPLRGGPLYRLAIPAYIANENTGFALGVARRALDEITAMARSKLRGYHGSKRTPLAARPVFQKAVGEYELKLRAARALAIEVFEKAWQTVCGGKTPDGQLHAEARACGTLVMDVAIEVADMAFRYGGGSSMRLGHILQRCLRDLYAASTHLIVSDSSYENYGKFILGLPADPMD